jgi:predicted GIY-YIG superfamily endonuclease
MKGNYYVYVLTPRESRWRHKKTYVGSTNDRARRVRQHNGELVGGAKRTRAYRPWIYLGWVSGFRNRTEALKFEWALGHSTRSVKLRKHLSEIKGRLGTTERKIHEADVLIRYFYPHCTWKQRVLL